MQATKLLPSSSSSSSFNNVNKPTSKPKKTSLFRRHSFNLANNNDDRDGKDKSPPSTSSTYNLDTSNYDGDSERSNNNNNNKIDEAYSYSDSEGGINNNNNFQAFPLRNRIRGLFGSFGKGGRSRKVQRSGSQNNKKQHQPLRQHLSADPTTNSPVLKATLGEFTRQIESLSAKSEEPLMSNNYSRQISEPIYTPNNPTYYTAHVTTSTTSSNSLSNKTENEFVRLRQKKLLMKNDSDNANQASNRNSVLSGSSESYEDHSVSDEGLNRNHGGSSNASPNVANDGNSSSNVANMTTGGDNNANSEDNDNDLTPEQRQEKKVFYIAREIMTSERVFVDILRLINVEFREFVQRARRESKSGVKIIPDSDLVRLFSNLPELQALNEDLLQDFEDRVNNWDSCKKISDVIVRKGPFLKLYTVYIREFSNVTGHLDECCRRYHKFGKLVREFERGERCRNLKLKHFLLKPVQRLPQYKLLLEDYLRHLDPESPDFDDTANALRIVSDAAEHANDTIKQGVRDDEYSGIHKIIHFTKT